MTKLHVLLTVPKKAGQQHGVNDIHRTEHKKADGQNWNVSNTVGWLQKVDKTEKASSPLYYADEQVLDEMA